MHISKVNQLSRENTFDIIYHSLLIKKKTLSKLRIEGRYFKLTMSIYKKTVEVIYLIIKDCIFSQ